MIMLSDSGNMVEPRSNHTRKGILPRRNGVTGHPTWSDCLEPMNCKYGLVTRYSQPWPEIIVASPETTKYYHPHGTRS